MILLWLSSLWANCETPLAFRDAIPQHGEFGIDPAVHPVISFVGQGLPEDISFSLWQAQTEVSLSNTGLCYVHESDTEKHCVWTLVPATVLEENTAYTITALDSTGNIPTGWSDIQFTTGILQSSSPLDSPSFSLSYFGPRNGIGVESCDWPTANTHEFLVVLPESMTHKTLLDVYFVDAQQEEAYVHTIFVAPFQTEIDFRQVISPGMDDAQCHYIQHRNHAGQTSVPSELLCHDGSLYGSQTEPEEPPNPSSEPVPEPTWEPNPSPTSDPVVEPTSEPSAEENPMIIAAPPPQPDETATSTLPLGD